MPLLSLLIWLAVAAIILSVAWYVVKQLGLPPEIMKVVGIAFVVIAAIIVIYLLLGLAGEAPLMFRLR